ncbi:MAG: carbamoyltransferase HypF [Armatimonadota bacterium]|nr:carbamoyltransferase HypF [Armatimonadota bacterium]
MNTQSTNPQMQRLRITVKGIVQGVGFRPFIYHLARKHGLAGWVCNTNDGVLIEAEGNEDNLRGFMESVKTNAPPLALITDVSAEPLQPIGECEFIIRHSLSNSEPQTTIPPDVATCADCLADISNHANRRYHYPFTNCTNCGPRFTIIERIPYDRQNTTMAAFDMCPDCLAEYENPSERRFHAQPNACPVCGPHLIIDGHKYTNDSEAISKAAEILRRGEILAIKGLGGFHLACDARNTKAVGMLRKRKGRAKKPFAVMCVDIDEVRRICEVDPISEKLLLSFERPIVIMQARTNNGISPEVAPGNNTLGVMLPYTPLHHLLLAQSPPTLVMTSGNLSEEPIAYKDEDANLRLGHIADHILMHNRPIHMACDDSVARAFCDKPMLLRRARGYVPQPIKINFKTPMILACGGDLKSTFCLTKGELAILSQHLGDLENAQTIEHYDSVVKHFCEFFDVKPEIIAHDLHPDYHSTRFAESLRCGKKIAVQHHHAHIASCMAENNISGKVIGVAFDGTGYGTDGQIWGSEFLIADFKNFQRAAHLAYIPIPGGEAAIKKPCRMAAAYLLKTFGDSGEKVATTIMPSFTCKEAQVVKMQIDRNLNAPLTSSMGRLFDAVSALLGICTEVTYEGQAAIELEATASPNSEPYNFELIIGNEDTIEIDVRQMLKQIVFEIEKGTPSSIISSRFHATIAEIISTVCTKLRDCTNLNRVVLSGGVFQNMVLLGLSTKKLEKQGFDVFCHALVPPNDGGISLGQAVVAAERWNCQCA